MSDGTARLDSLAKELPQLDGDVLGMTQHVRVLKDSAANFDERLLLQEVNYIRRHVLEWARHIEEVRGRGRRDGPSGKRESGARRESLANVRGLWYPSLP